MKSWVKFFSAALLLFLNGPNSLPPNQYWEISHGWQKDAGSGFHVLEAKSSEMIDFCRLRPEAQIAFPAILQSFQEIYADNILIYQLGDYQRDIAHSICKGPKIDCRQILNAKQLTWKLVATTDFFSTLHNFPIIEEKTFANRVDWQELIYIGSTLILFAIASISLFLFSSRLPRRRLFVFSLANVLLGLFCMLSIPGVFGISGSMHWIERHLDTSLILGLHVMLVLAYQLGLLSKTLLRIQTIIIVIAWAIIWFGHTLDDSQIGTNLGLFSHFGFFFYLFLKFCLRLVFGKTSTWGIHHFLFLFAACIMQVCFFNDFLVQINYNGAFVLLPLGFVCLSLIFTIFLREYLEDVFAQRDKFRRDLEESYSERIKTAQANTTANIIANLSQMIAHDIRKPYNICEMVMRQILNGSLTAQQIEAIRPHFKSSRNYVENLLNDLLVAGKARTDKMQWIKIEPLIQDIFAEVKIQQAESFPKVNLRCELGVDTIYADELKVRRLFFNLLTNAIEAGEQSEQHIWINVKHDQNGFIEIRVGNSGSFIPKERCDSMFTSFESQGKPNGVGLGLAICYEIVRSHQGEIFCVSHPEAGTEFILRLATPESGFREFAR